MKIFLTIYNRSNRNRFIKYFNNIYEKDEYKRKIKYVKNLLIIDDSDYLTNYEDEYSFEERDEEYE